MKGLLPILLLSLAMPRAAAQAQSADDLIARAIARYQNGDIDGAISIADQVISARPDDFRGYMNKAIFVRQLALANVRPALLDSAIVLLVRAKMLAPNNASRAIVTGNIGTTQIEQGHFKAAAESLNEGYAFSGRLFYRIRAAYALARHREFTTSISQIANLSTDEVSAADSPGNEGVSAYNMGLIYALAHRSADATRWLELAATLAPGRHETGFRRDTDLDGIRDTPDFRSFLHRHGIRAP
jgi:tetratricopeptide (TPR) repeat protein